MTSNTRCRRRFGTRCTSTFRKPKRLCAEPLLCRQSRVLCGGTASPRPGGQTGRLDMEISGVLDRLAGQGLGTAGEVNVTFVARGEGGRRFRTPGAYRPAPRPAPVRAESHASSLADKQAGRERQLRARGGAGGRIWNPRPTAYKAVALPSELRRPSVRTGRDASRRHS